jgi:hypothetical protein
MRGEKPKVRYGRLIFADFFRKREKPGKPG